MSRRELLRKDLAEILGISAASAGDLWKGKTPYSLDKLDQVAEALNIGIADLLGDTGPIGPGGHTGDAVRIGWRSRRRFFRHNTPSATYLRPAA